jgi:predicted nuclease of predicted toxin-antitoxin system
MNYTHDWLKRLLSETLFVPVSTYGWRNMSDIEIVDYSPRKGFEPLPVHTEDSPCNRYMFDHMYT